MLSRASLGGIGCPQTTSARSRLRPRQLPLLRVAELEVGDASLPPSNVALNGNGRPSGLPAAVVPESVPAVAPTPVPASAPAEPGPLPVAPERPLLPQIDLADFAGKLLGDPEQTLLNDILLGAALSCDGGAPRLYTPRAARLPGAPEAATLPLMFYLPGIDGTGLAAYRQFPRLSNAFDLRCLLLPRTDTSSFEALLDTVEALLRAELQAPGVGGRPVYLLGESFGGILALALAPRLGDLVDRLVLVNPATSFSDSPWPLAGPLLTRIDPGLYRLLPFALAPLLANPLSMAAADVDTRAPLLRQGSDLLYGLLDLAPELAALRLVLPAETLAHRLALLQAGCAWVSPRLKSVQQRVLVLAGEQDWLIPSAAEATRLGKELPRARTRVLPGRSHAMLQEAGLDIVQLMRANGFYVAERIMSNGTRGAVPGDGGGAAFGSPRPIQLPTSRELELDSEGFVDTITRLTSPVFYSTREEDGTIIRGLGALPVQDRPLLLVANHQFFAADMYPMIREFVSELGVLPRGLAHPIVFQADALADAGRQGGMAQGAALGMRSRSEPGSREETAEAGAFGGLLSTYGAVPVTGKNMHTLLSAGEVVLLYPGGAREACKRKGEAYKLFWPGKAEFIRMAAKFGATIVPVAAIGADEAITTHVTGEQLEALQAALPFKLPFNLPFQMSEEQRARMAAMPRARVGVNAADFDENPFVSPGIFTPNVPQRTYFIFRRPIRTTPALAADRVACQELYDRVRQEVEGGLGYLLRMREQDPYKDLLPRMLYEATWGGGRRAPSFDP